MASQYIEDLPEDVRRELENVLDNHTSINWHAFIQLMPQNSYQRHQIEGFRMETLHPNGSPTRALLNDLSIRRVTVQQLVCRLQQLSTLGPYPGLQAVIMKLQAGHNNLTITRQPDQLYRHPPGSSVYVKCEASPANAVSYQWFKKRDLLLGKTQSYLHLDNISKDHAGYYICRLDLNGQCQYSNWAKIEIKESTQELAKPIITTQPQSSPNSLYVLGGVLHLYCDAMGDPAPTFQWFKNDAPIACATGREYNKANMCIDDEGVYLCVATNSAGHAFSNRTTIKIVKKDLLPRTPDPSHHYVSDKVALLIGNKDYRDSRLGKLYHPTNDVCDVAGALRSIGFKVVSLVNLTLSEMRFAMKQFYKMLDKDMYALFYFAGHGFEVGNQSYLMPIDASPRYSPEENLSASEVIKPMQSTEARLNMVLLDSCRTRPSENRHVNPTEGLEVKTKNVIIVFPCCSKNSVFESASHPNGFFAIYLLKYLGDNGTIFDVIRKVSAGIDREDIKDPHSGQKQIVYTHHTITDELSLLAPIDDDRTTSRSTEGWKAAHEIPESPVAVFRDGDCAVELCFFAQFSNVLLVHARVQSGNDSTISFILEPGILKSEPRSGCIFERVDEKEQTLPDLFPRSNFLTQAIRIKDLQRLQGDLLINLEVDLARESCTRQVQYRMETKPLYAKIVKNTDQ